MMRVDLAGKSFVVTGSTQGLGEATALYLADCGAAGITICGRQAEQGERVAAALEARGSDVELVVADLGDIEACHEVIRRHAQRFDGLDGLVNAAASTARGTIEDTTPEAWDAMMHVNLRAPFFLMQDAVRLMKSAGKGGSIVNILSVSAHGGQPKLAAYSTSKGALAVLTKNVAHAVRTARIRVNGLNIGWMATPNEHHVQLAEGQPRDWLERADASQPFGRILRPEDVAQLIGYLLSDASMLMTGSIIDFDQMVVGAFD